MLNLNFVRTGLEASANVQARFYSGGMKRKLSSAMALIGGLEICMMDEPTTGVDAHARREFWKIIASAQSAGQSFILTSHR